MSDRIAIVGIVLALALVVGAFLLRGRHEIVALPQGGAYVLDRYTGAVKFCNPRECHHIYDTTTGDKNMDRVLKKLDGM